MENTDVEGSPPRLPSIFVDADACPVKDEIYRVAARFAMPVLVVANSAMRVPTGELVRMVVCEGFGAADDWIAEQIGPGDIAVTSDIPLATRCLAKGANVLDPRGNTFNANNIAEALAYREMAEDRRRNGETTGGQGAMTQKDRSRFLSKLDETINALRRGRIPRG